MELWFHWWSTCTRVLNFGTKAQAALTAPDRCGRHLPPSCLTDGLLVCRPSALSGRILGQKIISLMIACLIINNLQPAKWDNCPISQSLIYELFHCCKALRTVAQLRNLRTSEQLKHGPLSIPDGQSELIRSNPTFERDKFQNSIARVLPAARIRTPAGQADNRFVA